MAKRRCTAKTKKGPRCRNRPVAGHEQCIAHLPRNEKERLGFGGPQPGSGRPRKPRVVDVLRERIEELADEMVSVYLDSLRAERVVAVQLADGEPGEYVPITVPDLVLRLKAAEALNDRSYGKPRQVAELTGEGGGPIQLEGELSDPKVKEALFDAARAIDASRRRA